MRFYTGYTERSFEEENQNIISGNSETFRKALWAYLAGGFNTHDDNWHKLINLIFNNSFTKEPINTLKIKALWIDTINIITKESLDDGETETDDFIKIILKMNLMYVYQWLQKKIKMSEEVLDNEG